MTRNLYAVALLAGFFVACGREDHAYDNPAAVDPPEDVIIDVCTPEHPCDDGPDCAVLNPAWDPDVHGVDMWDFSGCGGFGGAGGDAGGNTGNTGGTGNVGNTGGTGNTGNGGSGNESSGGTGNVGNTGGTGNTGNGGSGNESSGGAGNVGNTGGAGNVGNAGNGGAGGEPSDPTCDDEFQVCMSECVETESSCQQACSIAKCWPPDTTCQDNCADARVDCTVSCQNELAICNGEDPCEAAYGDGGYCEGVDSSVCPVCPECIVHSDCGDQQACVDGECVSCDGLYIPEVCEPEQDFTCRDGKLIVCHFPHGNWDNRHEICISEEGWENGHDSQHDPDYLGLCQ